jgi:malonyl-CoA O-methyltransferase
MHELQALGATDARSGRARGLMGRQRWQALNGAYPRAGNRIDSSWEVIGAMAFRPAKEPLRFEDDIVAAIDSGQIRRRQR